ETSVIIPVVALLYAILFPFNKKYKYFITILSWIVLIGSWFYLRSFILSDISEISEVFSQETLVTILQSNLLAAGKVFVPVFIAGKFPLWIGILSMLLLFASIYFMKVEKIKLVLYGIAWFFLCITLPAAFKGEFNEWWLYTAMIGVFISIGELKVSFRNQYIPLFLIMILTGIFVVMTIERNKIFRDEISFANYYLRSNPDNPTSLYFRGVSHAKNKNHIAAIKDLTRVLELKPGYTNAYYNRAINYFKIKEFRKSIEDLNYVLANSPPVADGYLVRGVSCFYIGKFQKAYDDFTICFRLSSQNPMAFYYMGLSCYELGKYDEGLNHLYRAREMGYEVNPIIINRFLDKKMKRVDN
ncbi:MAG: tetratricopeptide repeat protein, partial [Bacteroidales bacterium]|nr:tetratricopeptide repeat protein [Bacteroidales bacterium]